MRRFELYLDNNDRLTLAMFRTIDSKHENTIFRGKEIYKVIRKLSSSNLVDMSVINRGNDLILEYKSYVVNVNKHNDVFIRRGISPLLRNIKEYGRQKF